MKVEYIQHSGSDLIVVNAARVSMDKKSSWEDVVVTEYDPDSRSYEEFPAMVLREKDAKLIKYLAKHQHYTPFEHTSITLLLKVPLFIRSQIHRHRTFAFNEISRRYVDSQPEFFWPDKWRKRAESVKQGSSDDAVPCILRKDGTSIVELTPQVYAEHLVDACLTTYNGMLESGVAPELARMILPQNMYTQFYMTGKMLPR